MADTTIIPEAAPVQAPPEPRNPMDEANWIETLPAQKAPDPAAPAPSLDEADQIVNSDDFFRTNFGWDSLDAGKREVEELRQLKTQGGAPKPVFANETSEKIFNYLKEGKEEEVFDYLDRKKKLSAIDKMPGADAIKLQIQQANPHYKAEDIQDVFEERYTLPEKPQASGDETDPDYVALVAKWQQQVEKINRRIERDSFTARQDLAKLNSQLVLPDIVKADPNAAAAAQKELEAINQLRAQYLSTLESDYKKFNGFNAEYKDEEVSIPISYTISSEELAAMKGGITEFDIDGYFTNRWFPEGKPPNIQSILEDKYLLENRGKIFQKLVNESASKMKDHINKIRKNIDVSGAGQNSNQTFQPTGPQENNQVDHLWANA